MEESLKLKPVGRNFETVPLMKTVKGNGLRDAGFPGNSIDFCFVSSLHGIERAHILSLKGTGEVKGAVPHFLLFCFSCFLFIFFSGFAIPREATRVEHRLFEWITASTAYIYFIFARALASPIESFTEGSRMLL